MQQSNGSTPAGGTGGDGDNKQPQIDDAKHFLERVKDAFKDKKGVYDRFVEIMKNFKHDRLNTGGVIKEVENLFGGHTELFIGFQNFLPNSGLLSEEEAAQFKDRMARQNSANNTNQNNDKNQNNSNTNNSNNNSNSNTNSNTNTNNTNTGTSSTGNSGAGNQNTNNQNNKNNNSNNNAQNPPDFNMAVTFICKIKQRFGAHRKIYNEFLAILQHFQTAAQNNDTTVIRDVKLRIRALFRDHPDLLEQFDYFLPPLTAHFRGVNNASSSQSQSQNGHPNGHHNGTKRPAPEPLDHPNAKRARYNNNNNNNRRKSRKLKNENTDSSTGNRSDIDDPDYAPIGMNNNISDHNNIGMKTRSSKKRDKDKRNKKRERDRRNRLISNNNNTTGGAAASNNPPTHNVYISDDDIDISSDDDIIGNTDSHQGLKIFSRLRKDIPDSLYKHILTLTQLYPMGLTEFNVVGKLICDALKEHGYIEQMKEFQKELNSSKQSWFFRSRGQNYYEYLTNNGLLKSCKGIQSSYRQLPTDVIQPRCSGRHPDALKVLNDYFVSKPTGGEGGGNNNNNPHGDAVNTTGGRLKNQYNENLQKSEDDLFELDMMIETNNAARQRLEQLYKQVMAPKNISSIAPSSYMDIPPVEKRAIARLYSEHGNKVLTLLKKMPQTTIPVVLKRLREKSKEWLNLKNEMKVSWKTNSDKNYFKAHDYRFSIFKTVDLKKIAIRNLEKQAQQRHYSTTSHINISSTTSDDDNTPDDDKTILKPVIKYDTVHHSDNRSIGINQLDFFNSYIASGCNSYNSITTGVINGVGLIGNASHDYIIQKMGAGLHVELGNYCEYIPNNNNNNNRDKDEDDDISMNTSTNKQHMSVINNCDFRFIVHEKDILRDCADFIFQYAKKLLPRGQRKLFSDLLFTIFSEFFNVKLDNKQIDTFMQKNDDSSDDDDDDEDDDNDNDISRTQSQEPMALILNYKDVQNENDINNISINIRDDRQLYNYLSKYYDNSRNSILLYGNKIFYLLLRYIQMLYARMCYAQYLCSQNRGLYRTKQSQNETRQKYQDYLSTLYNLINGDIETEHYEDECRKLLGINAYQLFTVLKVIEGIYKKLCDLDCDTIYNTQHYLKLFLYMKKKRNINNNKDILTGKYYVAASKISNQIKKTSTKLQQEPPVLYRMEYFDDKILTISIADKYQFNNNNNNNNEDDNDDDMNNTNNNDDDDDDDADLVPLPLPLPNNNNDTNINNNNINNTTATTGSS